MKIQSAKAKSQGLYRHATSAEDYLLQRINKTNKCWLWTRGVDKDGYGQCQSSKYAKLLKVTRAHQMAYVVWIGKISNNTIICHTCDTPGCCNPKHLYAGTWKSNVRDCIHRNRYRSGMLGKYKIDRDTIIGHWGSKSCIEVAKLYNISFSLVCSIWRNAGLAGRQMFNNINSNRNKYGQFDFKS